MGNIILITGGARSGKSTFAEDFVKKLSNNTDEIAYIATSQIYDEEMKHRVQLHRQRRPKNWKTYEAPFDAEKSIKEAFSKCNIILFDCLTLYLSNILCNCDQTYLDNIYNKTKMQIQKLIDVVLQEGNCKTMVMVTNEVGSGIVPENKFARIFRDIAGSSNQQIAKIALEVYVVISGIPIKIK